MELVDEREYQKVYMKPTLDGIGFKFQKSDFYFKKSITHIPNIYRINREYKIGLGLQSYVFNFQMEFSFSNQCAWSLFSVVSSHQLKAFSSKLTVTK